MWNIDRLQFFVAIAVSILLPYHTKRSRLVIRPRTAFRDAFHQLERPEFLRKHVELNRVPGCTL